MRVHIVHGRHPKRGCFFHENVKYLPKLFPSLTPSLWTPPALQQHLPACLPTTSIARARAALHPPVVISRPCSSPSPSFPSLVMRGGRVIPSGPARGARSGSFFPRYFASCGILRAFWIGGRAGGLGILGGGERGFFFPGVLYIVWVSFLFFRGGGVSFASFLFLVQNDALVLVLVLASY